MPGNRTDYGTEQTDRAVKRVERRLSSVYRQAQRDIDDKLKDWQERHKKRDARYRQMVAAGKMSKEDYRAWVRGQVFQEKQWQARRDEIDNILLNADRAAQNIVNDGKLGVFTANANYMGYALERDSNIDTGFVLYSESTVARLIKDDPQILPKPAPGVQKDLAFPYYNKLMSSAITQGIVQGETISEIAGRVARTTGESSYKSAMRNARTAYTGAQNAGRIEGLHQAQRLGIKVKKKWLAILDSRTRDTHKDLDGQTQEVDDPFVVDGDEIMFPGDPTAKPALVYNCFVGETQIATDSDIIRSYRHDYSGDLVEVETAGGVHFTCTPNHPILTSVGWVPAALLNNGYNLLVANVRNEFGLRRNGNIKHIHTRMKALFNALHYVGLMDRDAPLRVDFHGDIPTTDVEVITKKWKLRGNGDSGCADGVNKLLFKDSNEPLVSKSAFVQHLGSVGFAAFRFIGSFGKTLAFFRRRLSHAVVHGFRTITGSNAAILQTQADDVAGNVQLIRECLDGFTGKVFVDNIVNIKITTVRHVPVYNLQTDTGHYFVSYIIPQNNAKCNGNYAIAKNCRCTLTYEYPDYPSTMPRRDAENGQIVADMTYREWEALKKGEQAELIDIPEPEQEQQVEDDSFAGRLASEKLSPYINELDYFEYAEQMQAWDGDRTQWIESVHPGTVIDMQSEFSFYDEPHCSFAPIDNAVARLYEQVPLVAEYSNLVLCDYDVAKFHLPDGEDDRRLAVDAIAQVFENKGQTVIAFRREWMNHSLKESLEERQRMIDAGQVLPNVFPVASPEGVVMHEWGHTVHDHFLNAMCYDDPDAQKLWDWYRTLSEEDIKTGLSEYATVDFGEFTAECFAEMQTSNPRPLARQYWQYMSGLIGRGY